VFTVLAELTIRYRELPLAREATGGGGAYTAVLKSGAFPPSPVPLFPTALVISRMLPNTLSCGLRYVFLGDASGGGVFTVFLLRGSSGILTCWVPKWQYLF
jgi:hypothetical protein